MNARRHLDRVRALPLACASVAWRHPLAVLGVVALVSIAAGALARRLTLEADLSVLLPERFESVQGLRELERRFGGVGYVVVVAEGAPPEVLERFAEDLAPRLASLEHIRYVDYRRPLDFFEDHALYFVELEDLRVIRDKVAARVQWERNQRNTLYVDLEEEPAPDLDFGDLEAKYQQGAKGEWLSRQKWRYYLDAEAELIALLAKPTAGASDLSYADTVVSEVREATAALDPASYDPGLRVAFTGRYAKYLEQQQRINADLGLASVLALVLLLGYLTFYLRSLVATALVVVPLVLGLLWMLGATVLLFEHLNILTGFLGAILMGLGIDHGIHLMSRYQTERGRGESGAVAIGTTFRHTARAVVIAALTTAAAFAALSVSEFRAFREFGVLAAAGLVAIVLAYFTVFPALLALADRWGWRPPDPQRQTSFMTRVSDVMARWAAPVFWILMVVVAFLVPLADQARFNYDFGALEGGRLPAYVLDQRVNLLLGYSQTPVAILTDDADDEAMIAEALRSSPPEDPSRPTVDIVATVADLVPADPLSKRAILTEIGDELARVKLSQVGEEARDRFTALQRMVAAEPFTRETLPIELRRQFMGQGGDGGFVLVFPAVSLADGAAVSAFARQLRGVHLPDGTAVKPAGDAMVLADILHMVQTEAPPILLLTLALILAITWGLLGGLARAATVIVPVVLLTLSLLGYLSFIGMELNYMNIIVIPILLGVGVDGAVHLSTRTGEPGVAWSRAVGESNRAILAAFLTTGIGFGALLVAEHPGLDSIGRLALVGTACNTVIVVLGFTAFLALRQRFQALTRDHGRRDPGWISDSSDRRCEHSCGDEAPRRTQPLKERAAFLVATVGLAGLSPVAPGTLGAAVALPLAWWIETLPRWAALALVGAVILVAVWASQRYVGAFGGGDEDPGEVVIDEVAGLLVTSLFVPNSFFWLLGAFVAFRVADIAKPWPVRWCDRHVKGGLGIVLDDVVAGLMAGGVLLAARLVL